MNWKTHWPETSQNSSFSKWHWLRVYSTQGAAFDGRRKDEDVYDLVFVLTHYRQGVKSVVEETTKEDFASEYFQEALECLRRHFRDITYIGPAAYVNFCGRPDLRALAFFHCS